MGGWVATAFTHLLLLDHNRAHPSRVSCLCRASHGHRRAPPHRRICHRTVCAGKKCANCIKFMERNKSTVPPDVYGKRCLRYFQQKFEESAAEAIRLDDRQTNRSVWKK